MLTVEKVDYSVNWKAFKRGCSFFIPCLDCKQARRELAAAIKPFKFKYVTKTKIEDGVMGLRIWRL